MEEWKKKFITPQEIHDDILNLIEKIPKNRYKNIFVIMRGGMGIGVYLSHYFNIPILINTDDINSQETLIVDDLTDTGETLIDYTKNNFDTAVIYYKTRSKVIPTYYSKQSPNNQWIVFPWEKNDEIPNRNV